ncbi:ATP-binding cassette domain-containing protein [Geopsychrobacter electrodiphilus]|uniref:ATP-binding cassette domain-containing protein n=1 Tax=Geopsychrobacter electrodiphilus TaxID=225196 RepID=UPI00035EE57C|nr:ATP-binding cassette domain-containing protein [Geopsychrobacter electrodiphilus]
MALISLNNLSLAFGGSPLFDRTALQIEPRDRIALIGRNGCGKSTLLRLLNGEHRADSGDIMRQQGLKTAILQQDVPLNFAGNINDAVLRLSSGNEGDGRLEALLSRLDLDPQLPVASLSGGVKRRVLLAAALYCEPDLLLLDEPTNHLDIDSILWLEQFLKRLQTTLVFVSHDRAFTASVASRIVELDRGQLFDYPCDYPTYLVRREERLHAEDELWRRQDKKLAEEEVWIRQGIKARRTRNMGRVRALKKMRDENRQRRARSGEVRLSLDTGERSGQMVIEAKNISFSYADKAVVSDLSIRLMRGDRVAILGPNGCGKSTLLKLLLDKLKPTTGTLRQGTNLQIVYFDQLREQLDENASVKQNVCGDHDTVEISGQQRHIYGYLSDFLFTPDRARTPVRVLSGGERNRLLLAKLFTKPANLLVLDEPTNDLDVETLDLLEELLLEYQGTLLLVSHDRTFVDNIVTSCLVFEGDGRFSEHIGGYTDWLESSQPVKKPIEEKTKPQRAKEQRPKRLSFKQKHELETLPLLIDKLETEQAAIHESMADPALYQPGKKALSEQLNARLPEVEKELARAYARWDELDALNDNGTTG